MQKQFLTLLQSALWATKPDTNGFPLTEIQWQQLIETAAKQGVVTLMYDGIMQLPNDLQPSKDLQDYWRQIVRQNENTYLQHVRTLNYLFIRLQLEGNLRPVLLKGLALASYYPVPSHRECGDIDVLFNGEAEAERANKLVESWGMPIKRGEKGESLFNLNDTIVEFHAHLLQSHHPLIGKKTREKLTAALTNSVGTYERKIEGAPVRVLAPAYNNLLLATHSLKHVTNEGIGLKQLCDVAMFLKAEHDQLNATELRQSLQQWKVEDWANLTYAFCTKHLAMPKELLPYPINLERFDPDKLWEEVWTTGNFGKKDSLDPNRPSGLMAGKLFTAQRLYRNAFKFARYAPGEILGKSVNATLEFLRHPTERH